VAENLASRNWQMQAYLFRWRIRMSWQIAAGRRGVVALLALGCALCGLDTAGFAQNACRPEDEIFGGYAILVPNGWGDLDYKINTIPNAFDVSNTYYFRNAPNVGLLIDGSGHFLGGTTQSCEWFE
jgi:hypothetical protein